MAWDDAMRVVSAETQSLIDQVNDLDYGYIGPYEKTGENLVQIEDLLLAHGLYIDGDADAVRFIEDECDEDASVRGRDEDDEPIAYCYSCERLSSFGRLPDDANEGEPDPDFTHVCLMCGAWKDPSEDWVPLGGCVVNWPQARSDRELAGRHDRGQRHRPATRGRSPAGRRARLRGRGVAVHDPARLWLCRAHRLPRAKLPGLSRLTTGPAPTRARPANTWRGLAAYGDQPELAPDGSRSPAAPLLSPAGVRVWVRLRLAVEAVTAR